MGGSVSSAEAGVVKRALFTAFCVGLAGPALGTPRHGDADAGLEIVLPSKKDGVAPDLLADELAASWRELQDNGDNGVVVELASTSASSAAPKALADCSLVDTGMQAVHTWAHGVLPLDMNLDTYNMTMALSMMQAQLACISGNSDDNAGHTLSNLTANPTLSEQFFENLQELIDDYRRQLSFLQLQGLLPCSADVFSAVDTGSLPTAERNLFDEICETLGLNPDDVSYPFDDPNMIQTAVTSDNRLQTANVWELVEPSFADILADCEPGHDRSSDSDTSKATTDGDSTGSPAASTAATTATVEALSDATGLNPNLFYLLLLVLPIGALGAISFKMDQLRKESVYDNPVELFMIAARQICRSLVPSEASGKGAKTEIV